MADVDNHLKTYRKLIYNKKDHRQFYSSDKIQIENNGENEPKIYFDE